MDADLYFVGSGFLAGLLNGLLGLGGGLVLTPLLSILFLQSGTGREFAVVSAAATAQAASALNLTFNLLLRARTFAPISHAMAAGLMVCGAFFAFLAPRLLGKPTALEIHIAFVTVCFAGALLQGVVLLFPQWRAKTTHPRWVLMASCASSTLGTLAGMGGGVLFLPSAQLLGYKLHDSITLTGYLALASLWLGSIGYAVTESGPADGLLGPINLSAVGLVLAGSLPGIGLGILIAKRHSSKALRICALVLMAGIGLVVAAQ